MVNFSVVTDSVYTLPPELDVEIPVAQVSIVIDGEKTIPSSQITSLDVVRLQREGHTVTTSAPNPQEWLRVFKGAEEPIIAITVSSKLSSSYNNALIAARLSKKEVYVVDSLSASIGQGLVVYHALLLSEETEAPKAVEILQDTTRRTRIFLSVGSMEFLARSGRIPWVVGKLGDFLGFHPILKVEDGVIKKHSLVRSHPGRYLANLVQNYEEPVIVGKVEPLKESDTLLALLKEKGIEVYETYTCPDIAVHVGPESFGVAFVEKR